MIAYKFTRSDGTDHKTGTVSYRAHLGKELVHPEPCVANGQPCATKDTGGYHLARTLMDAWTYGDPGSVFRCSCRKADILGEDETKVRVRALRVLSERPVYEAYGPHGKAVWDLIDSLKDVPWFAHVGKPYKRPKWAEKVETVDSWSEACSEADSAAYSAAYSAACLAADSAAYSAAEIMGGITDGYFSHLMEVYRAGHYPASFDGKTLVVY